MGLTHWGCEASSWVRETLLNYGELLKRQGGRVSKKKHRRPLSGYYTRNRLGTCASPSVPKMSLAVNTGDTQTRSSECTFERLKKTQTKYRHTKGYKPWTKKFRLWCRWHVYDISLIARRVHVTLFTLLLVSMDQAIANDQETARSKWNKVLHQRM